MLVAAWFASAQEPSPPLHVGPGITPPRIKLKVDPQYSPLARAEHVQGTVVFSMVVNEHGIPQDIRVISPLGFGLDEKAEEAIQKWRFFPGMKDGKPVPIVSQVQVNFRFPDIWYDERAEQRRTSYNVALKTLAETNEASQARAVTIVQKLAAEQFPPAMFLAGMWLRNGERRVAKDETEGWKFIEKAADKKYGPALYEVAVRALNAGGDPAQMEKQKQRIREAAVLGSIQAQFYLGHVYEAGIGVPADAARARRYFRLCGIQGTAVCRYDLGRLLLSKPDRSEDEYEEALAWLELAADQKIAEARTLVDREVPNLSASQLKLVSTWKSQLSVND